jgi:DNA-binding NarL/FixJ family response regulator
MDKTMPIQVLIADDHIFYREGVRALLARSPEISVAGEASTGEEAVALAGELKPDVILMDLKMPGTNGIDATRAIHEKYPNIAVLVITMFDDDDSVFAAMRAGALGYLLKDADRDELVRAIVAVKKGEAIFSPAIARRMILYFNSTLGRQPAIHKELPGEFAELTEREREILNLIAQGQNNNTIAGQLNLSIKTVQNYVSSILTKLQVADRAMAIVRAREAGFGKSP